MALNFLHGSGNFPEWLSTKEMGRLQSRPISPKEKDSTVLKRILILEEEMEAHPNNLAPQSKSFSQLVKRELVYFVPSIFLRAPPRCSASSALHRQGVFF